MKHNYNSIPNQNVKGQLVKRGVIYCASYLMSTLSHNPSSEWEDEIYDAFTTEPDYEEAATAVGWEGVSNGFYDPGNNKVSTAADWEELCYEEDIEPYTGDVFEHWIVEDTFARQLQEVGEKVLWDFLGMTIWCRTTTGQAISMDHCIGLVAEKMEILEGQTNHKYWSD